MSVSSMRGQRHSNALNKECERPTLHPSAAQALYARVWGGTTSRKRRCCCSAAWFHQASGQEPCAGPARERPCHTLQDRTVELEEWYLNQCTEAVVCITDVLQNSPFQRVCLERLFKRTLYSNIYRLTTVCRGS